MPTKLTKFDAVGASRKWREQSSALLAEMAPEDRIGFVNKYIAQFPRRFRTPRRDWPLAQLA